MESGLGETALIPVGRALRTEAETNLPQRAGMESIEEHPAWPLLSVLPLRLSAGIPLQAFKVRDLLGLHKGQVIGSAWLSSSDVPLKIQRIEAAWGEFEVVEHKISVRLTRLA